MTDNSTPDGWEQDPVAAMEREHAENPGLADAPPPDTAAAGPSFSNKKTKKVRGRNKKDATVKGGLGVAGRGRFGRNPNKAPTSAQTKRAIQERQRKLAAGARYGGGRARWWLLTGALILSPAIGLLALFNGTSKPDVAAVSAIVDERLAESGREFPTGASSMWAGQVLRVWGSWDEAAPEAREVLLSPYLSQGMDTQAGWNELGQQTVLYSSVNPEPNVIDANHAQVEAVYQIQDGSWRCVTIPVYAYRNADAGVDAWAFALSGNPTPTACAPRTGAPAVGTDEGELTSNGRSVDSELSEKLASTLFPGFFSAWASSDATALTQFTSSGVVTVGLGGAMVSTPQPLIGDAKVYVGSEGAIEGPTYKAYVPVTWTLAGTTSELTVAYIVPVTKEGDRWRVAGEPYVALQSDEVSGGTPADIPEPGEGVNPPSVTDNAPEPSDDQEVDDPTTGDTKPDAGSDDSPEAGSDAPKPPEDEPAQAEPEG